MLTKDKTSKLMNNKRKPYLVFQMASNNTSNVDSITVDEKLDDKLRILKVYFKAVAFYIWNNFQGEIKKIEAENKDYDRKNQNLESGICEVKKATDVVKKAFSNKCLWMKYCQRQDKAQAGLSLVFLSLNPPIHRTIAIYKATKIRLFFSLHHYGGLF